VSVAGAASVATTINTAGAGWIAKRHPLYNRRDKWWEFLRISYEGGQSYLEPVRYSVEFTEPILSRNSDGTLTTLATQQQQLELSVTAFRSMLHRHSREKAWEYYNRNRRARYFNIVKPVVNSLVSHAMKSGVTRDGPKVLKDFWEATDEDRLCSMEVFMRDILRKANWAGMWWVVADINDDPNDEDADGKPYVYGVSPQDVVDWQADDDGEIEWLKQYVATEKKRRWDEPFEAESRYRIWTKTEMIEYVVYESTRGPANVAQGYQEVARRPITIGRVPWEPVYAQQDTESDFPHGVSLVGDIAKIGNSIFNHCSLADEIAYKQTFSWLIIPDPSKSLDATQIGTNTAFGYDPGASSAKPEYISPDAKQLEVLMMLIGSELEQAKSVIGVGRGQSEGSKQKSSAAALELESDDKKSLLADIAQAGQDAERRIAELVLSYSTKDTKAAKIRIVYPRDFDVRSFKADLDEALAFQKLGLPAEVDVQLISDLVRRRWSDSLPSEEVDALLKSVEDKKAQDAMVREAMQAAALAISDAPESLAGATNLPPGAKPIDNAKPGEQGTQKPQPGRPIQAKATGA
jgi:hypothetical protein